ncbi:MAG: radical SAM protein, partial [Anaerovorax sp.]
MKNIGLYIHVPFCLKKCNYCDFLSFQGLDSSVQKAYFHSLLEEVRQWGEVYGNEFYVDSLFIGGGTPSLVDSAFIKELMVALKNHFFFLDSCEITIESNPKTLTEEKLTAYLDCGINRLSLGVQSMDEGLLKHMGRAHSPEDVLENY